MCAPLPTVHATVHHGAPCPKPRCPEALVCLQSPADRPGPGPRNGPRTRKASPNATEPTAGCNWGEEKPMARRDRRKGHPSRHDGVGWGGAKRPEHSLVGDLAAPGSNSHSARLIESALAFSRVHAGPTGRWPKRRGAPRKGQAPPGARGLGRKGPSIAMCLIVKDEARTSHGVRSPSASGRDDRVRHGARRRKRGDFPGTETLGAPGRPFAWIDDFAAAPQPPRPGYANSDWARWCSMRRGARGAARLFARSVDGRPCR